MTPLHLSCYWAHREAAGLLLRHCPAAAGVVDREGRSPMWVAAQRGHAEVVGMLLAAGADVRQANAVSAGFAGGLGLAGHGVRRGGGEGLGVRG